jgi:hypothetical protein
LDLFGPVSADVGGGVYNAGRPRLPTRLMEALLYLKHAFNESDEDVIQRWGETPTWQYFSGNTTLSLTEPRCLIDEMKKATDLNQWLFHFGGPTRT